MSNPPLRAGLSGTSGFDSWSLPQSLLFTIPHRASGVWDTEGHAGVLLHDPRSCTQALLSDILRGRPSHHNHNGRRHS